MNSKEKIISLLPDSLLPGKFNQLSSIADKNTDEFILTSLHGNNLYLLTNVVIPNTGSSQTLTVGINYSLGYLERYYPDAAGEFQIINENELSNSPGTSSQSAPWTSQHYVDFANSNLINAYVRLENSLVKSNLLLEIPFKREIHQQSILILEYYTKLLFLIGAAIVFSYSLL